jgi:hypothetical protein
MGMTTPTREPASRDRPSPRPVSDLALLLWLLAVLMAELLLTCWWFARMYSA